MYELTWRWKDGSKEMWWRMRIRSQRKGTEQVSGTWSIIHRRGEYSREWDIQYKERREVYRHSVHATLCTRNLVPMIESAKKFDIVSKFFSNRLVHKQHGLVSVIFTQAWAKKVIVLTTKTISKNQRTLIRTRPTRYRAPQNMKKKSMQVCKTRFDDATLSFSMDH